MMRTEFQKTEPPKNDDRQMPAPPTRYFPSKQIRELGGAGVALLVSACVHLDLIQQKQVHGLGGFW